MPRTESEKRRKPFVRGEPGRGPTPQVSAAVDRHGSRGFTGRTVKGKSGGRNPVVKETVVVEDLTFLRQVAPGGSRHSCLCPSLTSIVESVVLGVWTFAGEDLPLRSLSS